MINQSAIDVGNILVAEPFMLDPNFRRSVILLCDHSEKDGSVGFVLNKPLKMQVTDLIADFPDFRSELYFGGPVATDTIHYIHTRGDILEDSRPVCPGLYWGGDYEQLKELVRVNLIKTTDLKFFVGYSGWGAKQLDDELITGSWVSADMQREYAFATQPDQLWRQALRDLGKHYTVIAEIPETMHLN